MAKSETETNSFEWQEQAPASKIINRLIEEFVDAIPFLANLKEKLLTQTGTRLADWVDHFDIDFNSQEGFADQIASAGFVRVPEIDKEIYFHQGGLFPVIARSNDQTNRMGLKVDSVIDFLTAHQIQTVVSGQPFAARRIARVAGNSSHESWVIEKHGVRCWEAPACSTQESNWVPLVYESLLTRNRSGQSNHEGFQIASALIDDAIARLGVNRTCDLFFKAERHYWQVRNKAARTQKARQDSLGLGWANHDHHTYRSSRASFADLVGILEKLGFQCRERFYAGAQSGWGAQVLEQEVCGLVVFADVDLTEEELAGDFAHEGLQPKPELGTVGLWCALHGEAFLQAGMHHLECQFDYQKARELLDEDGVHSMDPFTDFDFLKQCFTVPEIWPIEDCRIDQLLSQGQITESQANEFKTNGAVGSHLEILERNNGFKGFNQTGVSKIIAKTDPRKLMQNS